MSGQARGRVPVSRPEFGKVQELLYELRIGQVMTQELFTIPPGAPMAEAKGMMRSRRVSGLPVLDGEQLVGILSLDDVITWLEKGRPDDQVGQWMTARVHTVRQDEPAVRAIAEFGRHGVGRLPVVDGEDRLCGLVTPGDIVGRTLRVMESRSVKQESARGESPAKLAALLHLGASVVVDCRVPPRDFQRAGSAATKIRRSLEMLALDPQVIRRAAIAAYEAEMNLVIHADRGGSILARLESRQLTIQAVDDGPGIPEVTLALTPGYSTAPDWIRELGFGAGMGLLNIKRCSDDFAIDSGMDKGTVVKAVIALDGDGAQSEGPDGKEPTC